MIPNAAKKAIIVFLLKTANNVRNSATNPLVPGNPMEPKLNIKKKNANLGIIVFKPLKKAMFSYGIYYRYFLLKKKSAADIKPCETICNIAP